jgi:hypothetical protein
MFEKGLYAIVTMRDSTIMLLHRLSLYCALIREGGYKIGTITQDHYLPQVISID